MALRPLKSLLLTLCLAGIFAMGAAKAASDGGGLAPIASVTRLVKLFGDLEKDLQEAAKRGDRSRIESLLADDFEERSGDSPGTPTPRDAWIGNAVAHAQQGASRTLEQIAARDLGSAVVVSFKWVSHDLTGKPKEQDALVVDIWTGAKDTWKLAARYTAPVGAGSAPVGAIPQTFKKKY